MVCSIFLFFGGDESAYSVTQTQLMKLAAMEGVYQGEHRAGLVPFGILNPKKTMQHNLEKPMFKFHFGFLQYFLQPY
ncbi:cytochrome ubiquinol oxidase subunit I [Campylobacter jejuni]